MIKVSVIIPVYNAADTIERCVDSILQIQRDDVEVVLVEDCSSDNSLSVCNMLDEKYSNVRCLFNDQNRGGSIQIIWILLLIWHVKRKSCSLCAGM